jgi:hypothetical protein
MIPREALVALVEKWRSLAAHYRDICLHCVEDSDTHAFNIREAKALEKRADELEAALAALVSSPSPHTTNEAIRVTDMQRAEVIVEHFGQMENAANRGRLVAILAGMQAEATVEEASDE